MATLSSVARNAACDAVVDLVNAGTPPGYISFHASGGTEAVHCHFGNDAFTAAGASTVGQAGLFGGTAISGTATATETVATARIRNAAGTNIISAITCGTSGQEVNLSSLAIATNDTVTISTLTVSMPA
jgi:hypothetical protein